VKEKKERNIVVCKRDKAMAKKKMVSALHIFFLTDVVVAVADFQFFFFLIMTSSSFLMPNGAMKYILET
jgi:hypothetical protein